VSGLRVRFSGRITVKAPQALYEWELQKIAYSVALEAIRIMRLRTRSSTDVHGKPFKQFSPGYAARRRLSGRETTPRVQLTGQLMNGIHITQLSGGFARVGWGSKTDTETQFVRVRKTDREVAHAAQAAGVDRATAIRLGKRYGSLSYRLAAKSARDIRLAARAAGVDRKGANRLANQYADRITWELQKLDTQIAAVEKAAHLEANGYEFFGIETKDDTARLVIAARRAVSKAMAARRGR
jgi:hypothetical protein